MSRNNNHIALKNHSITLLNKKEVYEVRNMKNSFLKKKTNLWKTSLVLLDHPFNFFYMKISSFISIYIILNMISIKMIHFHFMS